MRINLKQQESQGLSINLKEYSESQLYTIRDFLEQLEKEISKIHWQLAEQNDYESLKNWCEKLETECS